MVHFMNGKALELSVFRELFENRRHDSEWQTSAASWKWISKRVQERLQGKNDGGNDGGIRVACRHSCSGCKTCQLNPSLHQLGKKLPKHKFHAGAGFGRFRFGKMRALRALQHSCVLELRVHVPPSLLDLLLVLQVLQLEVQHGAMELAQQEGVVVPRLHRAQRVPEGLHLRLQLVPERRHAVPGPRMRRATYLQVSRRTTWNTCRWHTLAPWALIPLKGGWSVMRRLGNCWLGRGRPTITDPTTQTQP